MSRGVPRGQQCAGTTKAGKACQAFRIGNWLGQSHLATPLEPWFCPMHRRQQ